jgi:hypothetical protein
VAKRVVELLYILHDEKGGLFLKPAILRSQAELSYRLLNSFSNLIASTLSNGIDCHHLGQ